MRVLHICIVVVTLCTALSAQYPSRGGSNYVWYQVGNCVHEPYGVIYNYNTAKTQIEAQLQSMYNAGQRALRIPIIFARGQNTGTVMDSTNGWLGGSINSQHMQNLQNFLDQVRSTGFWEVEIGFFPNDFPWLNDDQNAQWNEDYYQINWNLIANLHPILVNYTSPMTLRIDLWNEGVPRIGVNPQWTEYCRRLWADYTSVFGQTDTLGISMVEDPDRVDAFPLIYGNNLPYLFDIHFGANAQSRFVAMDTKMRSVGITASGWIIGEALYNDSQEAQELANAISATGRTVFHLTQWPLARNSTCNVAPPADFSAYIAEGF